MKIKLFVFPQDISWLIPIGLSIVCFIVTCCLSPFNVIPFLISLATFLGFLGAWFGFSFRPWFLFKKSYQMSFKGVSFCYVRPFNPQEVLQIKMSLERIEQKLENKLGISKVCIIEDAFDGLIVIFTDSIDEKAFNARYGTSYKHIAGLASDKTILVDISQGIPTSAFCHEVAHVVLDKCGAVKDEAGQHILIAQIGA